MINGLPSISRRPWLWPWLALVLWALLVQLAVAQTGGTALVLDIRGAIGPATAAYVTPRLARAQTDKAGLVILRMDTPGGLDTSMREIIRGILASPVPVATYVGPSGARAASAGTYLVYASHIAAMAPGTNLGAATPVAIGIGGDPGKSKPGEKGDADDAKSAPKNPMEAKAMHDAAAYLRSLAQMAGRNAEWGEKAVRASESLSANEALKLSVIDVVATDVADLARQIDGRSVKVGDESRKLSLAGATITSIAPNWKEQLLATI